ncbi:M48 family metalloprotease [Fodinicurvata sp. EGI_FJ10296]|uniref:M48 family metalloprotease n=1 Tax=Fodinicurvata sp. EGI_FJ10296 TaxID=3231908 RepID=UPI0034518D3E
MTSGDRSHYAIQREARRRSSLFVGVFLLATAIIAAIVGMLAGALLSPGLQTAFDTGDPGRIAASIDWEIVLLAGLAVAAVIGGTAIFQIIRLGTDGATVAKALGATEVTGEHSNFMIRRYVNIVEETALAAALPVPRIFVLKGEKGINAFAAGAEPSKAAVAVTHGALSSLNRAELSGVVAHEMAHIRSRDTALNVRLMGLVHGLVALYIIGRIALRGGMVGGAGRHRRSGNNKGAGAILAIGLALLILGGLGMLFGRMMQAAVSRQREYLADATAVSFTGHPEGLANALKKIGALGKSGAIASPKAEEARHMMFSNASARLSGGMMSTHPPLLDRIRALDPSFDPATDPVWNGRQKDMVREARTEAASDAGGPWGLARGGSASQS